VVFDGSRTQAKEYGQNTRGKWVQRAAVARSLGTGQPPDEGHDVMRGETGLLGHDKDSVHAVCSVRHRLALDSRGELDGSRKDDGPGLI